LCPIAAGVTFTIAFTVSGQREHYLRKAIDSWARVRGIQDAHLLFCVDPLRPVHDRFPVGEFKAFLQRSFRSSEVIVNDTRLGPTGNTQEAMQQGFLRRPDDFVILAEEDLVVADDVLEWFTWAQRYREDKEIQTVCGHIHNSSGRPDQAVRVSWFSPLLWGTWLDRWVDFISKDWQGLPDNPGAWDAHLRNRIADAGLFTLFPGRSRVLHIGEVSTLTPGLLAEYFFEASQSKVFQASYPPQEFTEVATDAIRVLV
jgi:hypothetical protein